MRRSGVIKLTDCEEWSGRSLEGSRWEEGARAQVGCVCWISTKGWGRAGMVV